MKKLFQEALALYRQMVVEANGPQEKKDRILKTIDEYDFTRVVLEPLDAIIQIGDGASMFLSLAKKNGDHIVLASAVEKVEKIFEIEKKVKNTALSIKN